MDENSLLFRAREFLVPNLGQILARDYTFDTTRMNKSAISAENRLDLECPNAENCLHGRTKKDGVHSPGDDRGGAGAVPGMGEEQSSWGAYLFCVRQHILVRASAICGAASFWWRIVNVRRDNYSSGSPLVQDLREHVAHQRARFRGYAAGILGQASGGNKAGGKENQWLIIPLIPRLDHLVPPARMHLSRRKRQGQRESLLIPNIRGHMWCQFTPCEK